MSGTIKYTQEDRNRVIELHEQHFSDAEIIDITGFGSTFVHNQTTRYWENKKKQMNVGDLPPEENIKLRLEFNKAFNLPFATEPTLIDINRFQLQHALMKEELTEYLEACANNDLIEVADALTDMQEILYGMFAEHGMLHLHNKLYNEVHRSNMSKLDKNGNPIYREDGKVLKSEFFSKPDISKVLGI